MIDIIPAILSSTREDYHRRFKAVEPYTEWIQIDIVDGKFVPSKTIGAETVSSIRTPRKLEIHLMVKFIEDWIDPFVKARPERIIVPIESSRDSIGIIRHVRRHGIQIGFSLNPHTPISTMEHLIDKVDATLLLSINPGFQNQHFFHGVLQKIKDLKSMKGDAYIEVDGGIQPGIAKKCVEAGANGLCVGSYILKNDKLEGDTYGEKIKNAIENLISDVEGVSS